MSKRAVWCFTVKSGLHDATPEVGIQVPWASKEYTVVIGPVELPDNNSDYPHQHGYVACPPATSLTKGQAIAILQSIGAYEDGMYVKELDTTRSKYHIYCFKITNGTHSSAERKIKRACDNIAQDTGLKVTAKRLKTELVSTEGAAFVARNKQVIDVFIQTPDARSTRRKMPETVDVEENIKSYMAAIVNFNKIVGDAIRRNGIVTTHPAFVDASREDQLNAILCISLLPQLVDRARITDNIPGLWFHGHPHCGKSYLFSQVPNYKKVPTDAEGVSRFRLECDQSGFLIDDVDSGWLFKPSNSKTVKALAIGERETVKTLGDTQEVRGFVVITSNCMPDHLSPLGPTAEGIDRERAEKDHSFNCNAWKRRLVSLYFDEPVSYDPVYIDFDVTSLDIVARKGFELSYQKLESPPLKKLFTKYYDFIHDQWTDDEIELYNKVFDTLIKDEK
jgi:hypothetical protein